MLQTCEKAASSITSSSSPTCRDWMSRGLQRTNGKRRNQPACNYLKYFVQVKVSLGLTMNQITIKTPNPKFLSLLVFNRFYRQEYSQSCWYFDPSCELAPLYPSHWLTFSPPPFPVWISVGVCIYSMCNRGGGMGSGCVESINRSYTLGVCPDSKLKKLLYYPKQKPRRREGLRQINTCSQIPLQVIFKKSRHLGLESISYLVHGLNRSKSRIVSPTVKE